MNLPEYPLKIRKQENDRDEIYDPFRKQWVALTPEERVRQRFLTWMVVDKNYPPGLISVEKGIKVNGRLRRFDALIYNKKGDPVVLLEFKAPSVQLNNATIEQIAAYNLGIGAALLIVSNGYKHYCIKMDYLNRTFALLDDVPDYVKLSLHLPATNRAAKK